jgi:hypothetical protein
MFFCAVFKPRYRFILFAMERAFGSGKSCRFFQIFVKLLTNLVVMYFLVGVELPCRPQMSNCMENAQLFIGILIELKKQRVLNTWWEIILRRGGLAGVWPAREIRR